MVVTGEQPRPTISGFCALAWRYKEGPVSRENGRQQGTSKRLPAAGSGGSVGEPQEVPVASWDPDAREQLVVIGEK